jgi:hypothetical protein
MRLILRTIVAAMAVAACAVGLAATTADAGHRGPCAGDEDAEATVPGTGPDAVVHARRAAVWAWKHEVAKEHGWAYARWSLARDKKVECDSDDGKTECEVEAEPCH